MRCIRSKGNTKCYRDYEEYKKQNNRTRQTVRKAQAKFEKKLMEEFKEKILKHSMDT